MPGRGEFWKVPGTNKDGVNFEQLTTSLQNQITSGAAQTGHIIENEGTPLTQRLPLNFVGAGVVASDDGEKTVITIAGGAGLGHVIEDEGTPLAQQSNLNFTGAGVTATDSGGKTVVDVPIQPAYATVQDEGTPVTQQVSLNFVGAGVSAVAGGENTTIVTIPGGQELPLIIAASDETTDLTTGDAKVTFRMPTGFTLTKVKASVTNPPTGSTLIINIREGGVDILSTPITIDAGETTSETAVTPPVISDANLASDAEMKIDLDQIGSTLAGKGLKITLIGNQV